MNKFYTLLLLSGAALSANAQQINGSFDSEWSDCIPWDSKGNTKSSGTQPEGWTISNVYVGAKVPVGEAEAHNEGKAVKLTNSCRSDSSGIPYIGNFLGYCRDLECSST